MKSAYRTRYGQPDILKIEDVPMPILKKNEILVRVHASTVNRTDCAILTGKPFIMRFFTGLFRPQFFATGTDFAGIVEDIGKDVIDLKKGDRIWGFFDSGIPSHAEFMVISSDYPIEKMPDKCTFEEVASSAEAAHYAYNFINKIHLEKGQSVFVNGGTGAIGSAAIQILKTYQVKITATCRTEHFEKVKALGADWVIDYTKEDFRNDTEVYEFFLDAVGKSSFNECKHLLKKNGVYLSSELGPYLQNLYLPIFTKIFMSKKVIFPIPSDIPKSLKFIKDLIENGQFKPMIDKIFPLEKVGEAFSYVMTGQKVGNVVLKING